MYARRLSERHQQLWQIEKRQKREHVSPLHTIVWMNDESCAIRSLANLIELCFAFFSVIFKQNQSFYADDCSMWINIFSFIFFLCRLDGSNQRETFFGSGWRWSNVNEQSNGCWNRSGWHGLCIQHFNTGFWKSLDIWRWTKFLFTHFILMSISIDFN